MGRAKHSLKEKQMKKSKKVYSVKQMVKALYQCACYRNSTWITEESYVKYHRKHGGPCASSIIVRIGWSKANAKMRNWYKGLSTTIPGVQNYFVKQ